MQSFTVGKEMPVRHLGTNCLAKSLFPLTVYRFATVHNHVSLSPPKMLSDRIRSEISCSGPPKAKKDVIPKQWF